MSNEDGDKLEAKESVNPRRWLRKLNYKEIHAVQIGAALGFLAAVASSPYLLTIALSIALWGLGIRSSPYRDTKTGDKPKKSNNADEHPAVSDYETTVNVSNEEKPESGMAKELLAHIRRETHYYLVGLAAGDRIGWFVHQALFETAPDHYQQIPEIVQMLTAGF